MKQFQDIPWLLISIRRFEFRRCQWLAAISKVPAAGQGFEVAGRSKQDRIITYNRLNLVDMFVDAV